LRSNLSRRELLSWTLAAAAGNRFVTTWARAGTDTSSPSKFDGFNVKDATFKFLQKCARDDGVYSPSPAPQYRGNSDTKASDLAAITYAATLVKTAGWELPHREKSVEFIQRHQQPAGVLINFQGDLNPKGDLAILYNTTQRCVALRALGEKAKVDPTHALDRFFAKDTFKKLPWYTLRFYPLFYAAPGRPFPQEYRVAIAQHIAQNQAADGYLSGKRAMSFLAIRA
jgi:hypothetical protein